MYVRDLNGMRDFFVRFFGAKTGELYCNRRTGFESYFLSFDDGSRLELMTRPELAEAERHPYRCGYIHVAFGVGSRGRVDALTRELGEAGYDVVSGPRTTGDGCYESCISDPEGNLIEITE